MVFRTDHIPRFYAVREVSIYVDERGTPVSKKPQAKIFSNCIIASSISEQPRHHLDEHLLSEFNESLLEQAMETEQPHDGYFLSEEEKEALSDFDDEVSVGENMSVRILYRKVHDTIERAIEKHISRRRALYIRE